MALTPLLQAVCELLRPQLLRRGLIDLVEDDPDSRIEPFRLGTTQPALVLRFEQIPHAGLALNDRLFPLLNPTEQGLCLHCDYVILRQEHDREHAPLYVLLVELKSGKPKEAQKQIENTRILVDGMLATMKHARGAAPWASDVRYRGVIFTPNARPTAGDPKRHPCPYEATSQVMPDVLFVRHPPCPGYQLDWFCPP